MAAFSALPFFFLLAVGWGSNNTENWDKMLESEGGDTFYQAVCVLAFPYGEKEPVEAWVLVAKPELVCPCSLPPPFFFSWVCGPYPA